VLRVLAGACWIVLLGTAQPTRAQRELDVQLFAPPPGQVAAISIPEPELPAHGTLVVGAAASWAR